MALTKATYSMVKSAPFNILDYGASESATGANNTAAIQAAINAAYSAGGGVVHIPYGEYALAVVGTNPNSGSAAVALVMASDVHLYFEDGASFRLENTGSTQSYAIILVPYDAANVTISGKGTIIGDWLTHTGTLGEGGMGIWLSGCTGTRVYDVTIRECWGDGVFMNDSYASGGQKYVKDILLQNVISDSNRRQGYTFGSGENVSITDCQALNIGYKPGGGLGTAPFAGIDIEPDTATHKCRNLVLNNFITDTCVGAGIRIDLDAVTLTDDAYEIIVNNHCDQSSLYGLVLVGSVTASDGYIVINNPTYTNNESNGIALENCRTDSVRVFINRPFVLNPGRTASQQNSGAINFLANASMTVASGNVSVVNPSVSYDSGIATSDKMYYAFHFDAQSASGFDSTFQLLDPLVAYGDTVVGGGASKYYSQGVGTQDQFVSNLYSIFEDQGIVLNNKDIRFNGAAPVAGTWSQGDIVFNSSPTAGGTIGWVCTASGTPGTWKTFGAISV